jgi:Family of unknown function (DUF6516)
MYDELLRLALAEFGDVIVRAETLGRRAAVPLKLRFYVRDGTLIDVWLSHDLTRYAYHWEQRAKRGLIHRHDNAPDHPAVSTFPKHFHNGSESAAEDSFIPNDPVAALRQFLAFVRAKLTEYGA